MSVICCHQQIHRKCYTTSTDRQRLIVNYSNSACLVSDIQTYYEGRNRLDNQRYSYVESPIVAQDDSSANRACMQKYGIYLYNNGPGSMFQTRSYMCASYCGNNGYGMNYIEANLDSIYPVNTDRQYCGQLAKQSQPYENINACIVFCCDQELGCRDAAWIKLRNNNL